MVRCNPKQVDAFAGFFRRQTDIGAFDFCSVDEGLVFPTRHEPGVLEYFFFCTAHQFGFWHVEDGRYDRPMTAPIDGRMYKGSDFVWRCATRLWREQPDAFEPERVRERTDRQWSAIFEDDDGRNPLPMWHEHLESIRTYGTWFGEQGQTPASMVESANGEAMPLKTFLSAAGRVPGYSEDPMEKKLQLLAIILENRPEGFLRVTDPQSYRPIIDYHLQRSALRTGLVEVVDAALREKLERRQIVTDSEESAVRTSTYEAVQQLVDRSGASVAAIDYFFFTNRTRCPEMTAPQCETCPVQSLCQQETILFQPVYRTTAY